MLNRYAIYMLLLLFLVANSAAICYDSDNGINSPGFTWVDSEGGLRIASFDSCTAPWDNRLFESLCVDNENAIKSFLCPEGTHCVEKVVSRDEILSMCPPGNVCLQDFITDTKKLGYCEINEDLVPVCLDEDAGSHEFITQGAIYKLEDGAYHYGGRHDSCLDENTLKEATCGEDVVIGCPINTHCITSQVVTTEKNIVLEIGYCGFEREDSDFDTIPDSSESQNCLETSRGNPVNFEYVYDSKTSLAYYGCSCEQQINQGASSPSVSILKNDGEYDIFTKIDCSSLQCDSANGDLSCPDNSPGHCCDNELNCGELFKDCGTYAGCNSCDTGCSSIKKGNSGLDLLLVPVGYKKKGNFLQAIFTMTWLERSLAEAKNVYETPPFEETNIWRLDEFNYLPDFQKDLNEGDLDASSAIDHVGEVGKLGKEFQHFCGDVIDFVIFLPKEDGRSYGSGSSIVVYNHVNSLFNSYRNHIVHELGHAVCHLSDEYKEGEGTEQSVEGYESSDSYGTLNCDFLAEICDLGENSEKIYETCRPIKDDEDCITDSGANRCLCYWHPKNKNHDRFLDNWIGRGFIEKDFSDAGCVKGCYYEGERYFRPSGPGENDNSMMKSNYIVGPGENGRSSWNDIGYEACKQSVDKYV